MSAPTKAPPDAGTFLGHPRGLAVLFFTEMWERFGYYGMRALLILYLTAAVAEGGLGMDTASAGAVYALFTSTAYLMGLPGGWLADRLLGQRRAVFLGGALLAAGYLAMILPSQAAFFGGLATVVLGTGLLKPNISAIVGQLYGADDARRDAGFSLFYMGINLGAMLGPLVCSYLGETIRWRYGFAAAGVGMIFGLIQYVLGLRTLGSAGLPPPRPATSEARRAFAREVRSAFGIAVAGAIALAGLFAMGVVRLEAASLSNAFGIFLMLVVVVFFVWLFRTGDWTPVERGRLLAIAALFVAASFFWGAYEQAGSSLNLFAERSVDRAAFGREFPAGWFQWVPALFVIVLAPLFAWLWMRMGPRQPSSPAKFALGLLFVGLGFAVMIGAALAAGRGVHVSPAWLVATYFLHVVGELCLSPVGLSTVTKLAPSRVAGLMMGVWFLAIAVGSYLGGRVAGLYETVPLPTLFGGVTLVVLAAGALLLLATPAIRRLMGGVH